MAIAIGTTQAVVDWGRSFVGDPKTRTKALRNFEIGRTSVPTAQRETFYLKQPASSTVQLYVEPYFYTSTASLSVAAATDKVFMYNATLQSCIFPSGSDTSIRPAQFKAVTAEYEYSESLPYSYADSELETFLPQAIQYLNNNYGFSYTYTGTIGTNFNVGNINDGVKDIEARALAVLVRRSYATEQMKRGLGVAFRGPLAAIDSKTQLNAYVRETAALEKSISEKVDLAKIAAASGSGDTVDLYDESVVTS